MNEMQEPSMPQITPPQLQPAQKPEEALLASLPELPCPNCAANVLAHHGFYNYCDETSTVREDSYLYAHADRIYLDHDEEGQETDSHECRMQAFCGECNEELPWPLYDIRALDGVTPEEAKEIIARLIAEAQSTSDSAEEAPAPNPYVLNPAQTVDDPNEHELPEPPDPPYTQTDSAQREEVQS